MEIGLLALRFAIGLTLAAHGAQKLFGWFGGPGLEGTGQQLAALGFHPGRRHALAAGVAEAGGGLLLTLGLLTPLGAAAVVGVMLVAALSVHVPRGFFITSGGYEYTLVVGLAALSLAFTGPGALSIDAWLGYDMGGAAWGVAALVLGVVSGLAALAQRHAPTLATERAR